ncbi:MAG TPA: decarboxylase [Blastocatellia bacterium]|nr:decarboxylase [Blastocatellia bacterium]
MISPALSQQLLADYGSPLYVYDADHLRSTVARIRRAVPYPHTKFFFASVVNGNVSLMRIFRECGWGLHANTPGDVFLGLQAGFAPGQMVYSGSNLNREEMAAMLRHGVGTLNLDSISQLKLLCELWQQEKAENREEISERSLPRSGGTEIRKAEPDFPRLGFRLNLPEITGDNRIGVSVAELCEAVSIAARAGLKASGIHFYRGTGTNATDAFTESIAAVLEAGKTLPDWGYLDFGGGFGYPYREGEGGFDWGMFGAELSRQTSALGRPLELFIEPGRAAIAGCGTLLAKVVSVKWQGERQIVGVDTSVANIAVLSVHGGHREIRALKDCDDALHPTDVCGNTTYSRDYLGRGRRLPAMRPDDVVAILGVGAYGYAMSSHFLHRPRPAEVLVEQGTHRLIRRRESYDVLLEHQVLQAEGKSQKAEG